MKLLNTYAIDVLGCKVNQYDARQIVRLLEGFGLRPVTDQSADLVVVHTCGVTATAVQKSRQAVRRLARRHPGALVFFTGCAAEESVTGGLEGIDVRVAAGAGWVRSIADHLQSYSLPNPDYHLPDNADELPAEEFGGHARAYLKIQDGCDAGCAYCIVPQLRKAPRDKSISAAVSEANELVQQGYREIVIAGVHVGLYGRETDTSLAQLLSQILQVPQVGRVRMSSLHPNELTPDLLAVWASSPQMMPHLHLSLQSGSNGVLQRMGRGYTAEEYFAAVERARGALDRPAITTDVIVGFPGETEAEFEQTVAFCKQVGFAGMHIFSFSPRPGTRAVDLPNPVDPQLSHVRHQRLAALAKEMSQRFNEHWIGQSVEVLVERCRAGVCSGVSKHYIPVRFLGAPEQVGSVVSVSMTAADHRGLTAL